MSAIQFDRHVLRFLAHIELYYQPPISLLLEVVEADKVRYSSLSRNSCYISVVQVHLALIQGVEMGWKVVCFPRIVLFLLQVTTRKPRFPNIHLEYEELITFSSRV